MRHSTGRAARIRTQITTPWCIDSVLWFSGRSRTVSIGQVARIDSDKWAVSARGFCDRVANKLLVLMDGRSIHTPLFSGVVWSIQDTLLEDTDRIEVIRGPGG